MQRWTSRKPPRYLAEITVIPLIDLVLVLLFIYMIVAPLLKTESVVQPVLGASEAPADRVVLRVGESGALTLNGHDVAPAGLDAALQHLVQTRPGVGIIVQTPAGFPASELVRLSETLRAAGIEKLAVAASAPSP